MAIVKIEEVYLYVTECTPNAAENVQAAAFMDHSGIPFDRLFYNDIESTNSVMESVNTWWARGTEFDLPPVTKFPFLTYVEVHDNIPARYSPVKYLEGIDNIKTFPEIFNAVNSAR